MILKWKVILNEKRVYYWNNYVDAWRFAKMYDCPTPHPA
jgi:hypothetical protein